MDSGFVYHWLYLSCLAFDTWISKFFQNVRVSNKRYLAILNGTGWTFSIIVCLAFAMMPVSAYLGWVK